MTTTRARNATTSATNGTATRAGDADPPSHSSRRRSFAVSAVLAGLVCVFAVWLVAFSSVLGVKSVAVRGAHEVSVEQILTAAGIRHGAPLVRLDTAALARRIDAIAGVASATVGVSYPNTVVVTVVERVALGYLESGSRFVLVDGTGAQFRSVGVRPVDLPLFAVPTGPNARATGRAVASVAAALPASLLAKLASIQALDPAAITLLLKDQRLVYWGSAEQNAAKASILPTLLRQPGTRFDVTDPNQVFAH